MVAQQWATNGEFHVAAANDDSDVFQKTWKPWAIN